jgi:hypothetical protein
VWAVGYFTDEDYFQPEVRVLDLPGNLHRGQKLFARDGTVRRRLQRSRRGGRIRAPIRPLRMMVEELWNEISLS